MSIPFPVLSSALPSWTSSDSVFASAINSPDMDASPANNDNTGGQPLNAARNVPAVEMKFKDVENYMVEKAKKESLELVQDLESKQMKALN